MNQNEDLLFTDALVITNKYETKEDWCKYIHQFVKDDECTYMEAIIHYCESNDKEIASVSKLIDDNIKERIRKEAEADNMMRPIGRLDFSDEL